MIRIASSQNSTILGSQTNLNSLNNTDTDVIHRHVAKNEKSLISDEELGLDTNYKTALEKAVDKLNKTMEIIDRGLEFSIHEGTNRLMVKVIDRIEDEIIREIPPEKLLDLMAEIINVIGLLVDCRV